ncbi:MAG TPA: NADH-quinone oxidoreductase subunit J [Chthoniobacterales bacterium]|jgi:NADH-quinone oxidoreductase subunit J
MIGIAFIALSVFTLATSLAAALMPKLIHAALSLVLAFGGLAAFYFLLGAEFVGLVQIFVYVGAVAVLIVFTILLTRREVKTDRGFNWSGVVVAMAVFGCLVWAILRTPDLAVAAAEPKTLTVKLIGEALMMDYVWPLQCVGLVLTAALIGALVLVTEKES